MNKCVIIGFRSIGQKIKMQNQFLLLFNADNGVGEVPSFAVKLNSLNPRVVDYITVFFSPCYKSGRKYQKKKKSGTVFTV